MVEDKNHVETVFNARKPKGGRFEDSNACLCRMWKEGGKTLQNIWAFESLWPSWNWTQSENPDVPPTKSAWADHLGIKGSCLTWQWEIGPFNPKVLPCVTQQSSTWPGGFPCRQDPASRRRHKTKRQQHSLLVHRPSPVLLGTTQARQPTN